MARYLFQGCVCIFLFSMVNVFCYGQQVEDDAVPLPVEVNSQWGYINQSGDIVISPQFDHAAHFSDGWAKVKTGDKLFFIKTSGETVLNPDVSSVESFSEGLAVASKPGSEKWGFINKKGDFVIEPRFNFAFGFSEGKAAVCKKERGECGYINKEGKVVIKQTLDGARKFANGLAPAKTGGFNGQWGYIDAKGEFVIKPQFEQAMPFSEEVAAVRTTVKKSMYVIEKNIWGYINKEGMWVIEPGYEFGGAFSDGLAPVQYHAGWKFINKKGELAFLRIGNERIGFTESFRGDLARATTYTLQGITYGMGKVEFMMEGVQWVYLNKLGKVVWPKSEETSSSTP